MISVAAADPSFRYARLTGIIYEFNEPHERTLDRPSENLISILRMVHGKGIKSHRSKSDVHFPDNDFDFSRSPIQHHSTMGTECLQRK